MGQLLEIFCDFDGTITKADTVDLLLGELADPEWQEVETRWERGEIGSRECMGQQVALLRGGWTAIEKALEKADIDPTFVDFVSWCKDHAVNLNVVSDGIDRTITHILKREGIRVDSIIANHLHESHGGSLSLTFPHGAQEVNCQSGVCKCKILNRCDSRRIKIFIGDGRSDFCCAPSADYLFAKSKLLKHCHDNNIACIPFGNFNDVKHMLEAMFFSARSQEPASSLREPVVAAASA